MLDKKTGEILAIGRRKTASARVRIKAGNGKITINHRTLEDYFRVEEHRTVALQAFAETQNTDKYDVRVNVIGGGSSGQAVAVRLGIARALLQVDATLRPVLKADGFLTRDPRERERKKYGQRGARKRFQYSKR
ncbi:MAG: 30S ribosomal protein S9 [Pedosphaera sp.]|nr:30S ribosomal protein S9 [Pedosphaera sp.]